MPTCSWRVVVVHSRVFACPDAKRVQERLEDMPSDPAVKDEGVVLPKPMSPDGFVKVEVVVKKEERSWLTLKPSADGCGTEQQLFIVAPAALLLLSTDGLNRPSTPSCRHAPEGPQGSVEVLCFP